MPHAEFNQCLEQFLSDEELVELKRGPYVFELITPPEGVYELSCHLEKMKSAPFSKLSDLLLPLWRSLAGPLASGMKGTDAFLAIQQAAYDICASGCDLWIATEFTRTSGSALRFCVNILFLLFVLLQKEYDNLSASIITLLEQGLVPAGKLVLLLAKLIPGSDDVVLGPSISQGSPELTDFQSFMTLGLHQRDQLVNWSPPPGTLVFPRPKAIDEAIALTTSYLGEFAETYSFQSSELLLLREQGLLNLVKPVPPKLDSDLSSDACRAIPVLLKILLSLCRSGDGDSVASAILGILLVWIPRHDEQIVAHNGCLVLLRIITSVPEEEDCINEGKNLITYRALSALYILCKQNPGRIKKYLIHYKVAVVLKRFFASPLVAPLAYKLFKIQVRYLTRKWKFMHIKLISSCYAVVPTNPIDDWLTTDEVEDDEPSLNDSMEQVMESTYFEDLNRLDFESESDISKFCQKYSESIKGFFNGFDSFDAFIRNVIV